MNKIEKMSDTMPISEQNFTPKQETINIEPYNKKQHRRYMPFKKGQGVSIAGWQFEVISFSNLGNILLRPVGKILP